MNLIQAQQEYIDAVLAANEYSGKHHPITFLNRKARTLRKLSREYREKASKLGLSGETIDDTLQDAKDMAELEYFAD